MRCNSIAALVAALSFGAGPAMADSASAELDASWSGSPGVDIFLALTGSDFRVDGMDFSTHGAHECGCFSIPFFTASGENVSTGRVWSTSWDGRFYTIDGYQASFNGGTQTEFAVPAGGTLDVTIQFDSLHGDNSFSFTDPNGVTTTLTSRDTVHYTFTNTTGDWAFESTSLFLGMAATVPEPSEALLMLVGMLWVGRRLKK